jgi:hypothetical protein
MCSGWGAGGRADELVDLRVLLRDTMRQPGATLASVLAVVQQELLAG